MSVQLGTQKHYETRRVPDYADYAPDRIVAYVDDCCAIADWCDGVSYMMHTGIEPGYYHADDPGFDHIVVPDGDGVLIARAGEWIGKADDGTVAVFSIDAPDD